jgi:phosphonate transport system substrate-binding protein
MGNRCTILHTSVLHSCQFKPAQPSQATERTWIMKTHHHCDARLHDKCRLPRLVILLVTLVLLSCSDSADNNGNTLRFSVLPDSQRSALKARYEPLIAHLENKTGIKCELIYSRDYRDLLGKFIRGEIDIARFGGITFTMAQSIDQAEPLVMRNIDKKFTSYFLVNGDNSSKTLAEFKGKRFGFGSRLSTSGHLMPRYFLGQENIQPEVFFSSVQYSGAHDRTAKWVSNGTVDIGVANAVIIDRLLSSPQQEPLNIRILQQTPPYANYVWAARKELPQAVKKKISTAFLGLSKNSVRGRKILTAVGARNYLPALKSDFETLQKVVRQLGILEDTRDIE